MFKLIYVSTRMHAPPNVCVCQCFAAINMLSNANICGRREGSRALALAYPALALSRRHRLHMYFALLMLLLLLLATPTGMWPVPV